MILISKTSALGQTRRCPNKTKICGKVFNEVITCQPRRYDCSLTCRTQLQLSYVLKLVKEYTASIQYQTLSTSVLWQFFRQQYFSNPYWTDFPIICHIAVKPSTSRWVGFHLLIVLIIALVFGCATWNRTKLYTD